MALLNNEILAIMKKEGKKEKDCCHIELSPGY